MNKMIILSALTSLPEIFNLSAHSFNVQPRTISATALHAPRTASQIYHFLRCDYE